ncbi:unnamed protein product [Cercospora beticola]|nr:unnamed protein product [Cercospora beticola]
MFKRARLRARARPGPQPTSGSKRPVQSEDAAVPVHARLLLGGSDFCQLLLLPRGAVRHQILVTAEGLYDLQDVIEAEQILLNRPEIQLSRALQSYNLSDDGKIFLAHSIARTLWQLYDTKFINGRWTADSIHFVQESPNKKRRKEDLGMISPVHPFVQLPVAHTTQTQTPQETELEFVPHMGSVHWAPRILALGVVLTNIFNDDYSMDEDQSPCWQARFNDELLVCRGIVESPSWPSLQIKSDHVREKIREAVLACLRGDVFNKREADILERKALLWKHIVSPLEMVGKLVGVDKNRATWQAREESVQTSQLFLQRRPAEKQNAASSHSQQWLSRLASSLLNKEINAFYRSSGTMRTKIAILDTGYDPENLFMTRPRQNRLKNRWKDFVDDSSNPLDEDGHGTHVLATLMTIAPSADVCVARVATNDADFDKSYENIVKALEWVVNDMEADVVSMSFGWPQERESRAISRAISNAISIRKDAILFYAAASNSGGDQGEMFPATHEFVTAVRATTHEGEFVGFNAPPNFGGADVIGTLGVDMPGAFQESQATNENLEGTSFAAPVAAAISALVLDAAKMCDPIVELGSTNNMPRTVTTLDKLRTRHGMNKMFCIEHMARKINERSWYLSAAGFCNRSYIDRKKIFEYILL